LDVFDDMRRTFEDFFASAPEVGREGRLAVDVRQEEDKYTLEADIPGMTEKDVDVRLDGDVLTISGNKEESQEEKREEGYILRERRKSQFQRSLRLPPDVATDKIDARFNNGQLVIHMPRTEAAKPKKIDVKSG
jgi:HSP20 family molecular chaperone IbpA